MGNFTAPLMNIFDPFLSRTRLWSSRLPVAGCRFCTARAQRETGNGKPETSTPRTRIVEKIKRHFRTGLKARALTWAVFAWAVVLGGMPSRGWAGPVPSSLGAVTAQREADLRRIEALLTEARIGKLLARQGIQPEHVREKLEKMSDQEIHMLAERLDKLKSGGQVVTVLLIILLVILIVYFMERV